MNVRRYALLAPIVLAVFAVLTTSPAFAGQVLKYDDGTAENGIGLDTGATGTYELWWANAFQTSAAGQHVEAIEYLFLTANSGLASTDPVTFLIYNDPNNDGEPLDRSGGAWAVPILYSVTTTIGTLDTVNRLLVPDVDVSGWFFVAAVLSANSTTHATDPEFPAALDEDSSAGYSWIAATDPSDPDTVGPMDLADLYYTTDTGILNLDDIGLPGNWMLRVETVPEPGTFALFGLGAIALTLGARRRRRKARSA